jgi:HlyD family secretion protein
MPAERQGWLRGKAWLALAGLLILACGAYSWSPSSADPSTLPRVAVQRTALTVRLRTAGEVASSVETIIRCEVENSTGTRRLKAGSTTILSLVPEGTRVRAGDVLCRLDASEYEELARVQQIVVAQARARHARAVLEHEVAEVSLRQFLEGNLPVRTKGFQGRMATASAEVARQGDRLEWSRRMRAKGYGSLAQLAREANELERAKFDLAQVQGAFHTFEKFEAFTTRRALENQVKSSDVVLEFQTLRLSKEETRLAKLQQQIARCTIRAPHDGQVILAHKPKRGVRIEEGLPVRQKQALIYLPDMSQLEIHAWLHETVVDKVRPGMRATVRPEGCPRALQGEVVSIDYLPVTYATGGAEVTYYRGRVRLADVPPDLRLRATAEVEIDVAVRHAALVVPAQAVLLEDGRHVCYVATREGLARRPVSLGRSTPDCLEVVEGLVEGEEVVLLRASPKADKTRLTVKSIGSQLDGHSKRSERSGNTPPEARALY